MGTKKQYYIVVTPFFPSPGNWRGPFVYDQVKAIKNNTNYEVVVFRPYLKWHKKPEDYIYEGIEVVYFPTLEMPSYFLNGLFNSYNKRFFIKALQKFGLLNKNIAAVHCHTSPFGIYGLVVKKMHPSVKVLLHHHDRDPLTIRNGILAKWKTNMKFRAANTVNIVNNVDCNICISHVVEDNLLSFPQAGKHETYEPYLSCLKVMNSMHFKPVVNAKKSIVLYNGVDLSKFYPLDKCDNNTFTIGCIANFQMLKGHMTLLKALYEIIMSGISKNRLKLIFVGSGETLEDCKNFVQQHDMKSIVEFKTEMVHSELINFYNSLDVFVLPSMFEGFGCVLTESYACGVPFMICKHQGAAECIDPKEQDKWTFDAYDYKRLASILLAYQKQRYQQHLCAPIDINILIKKFLKEVGL